MKKILKYIFIFIFFTLGFMLNTASANVNAFNNTTEAVIYKSSNNEAVISSNKENNSAYIKNETTQLKIKNTRNGFSPFIFSKSKKMYLKCEKQKNKFNLLKRYGFSSFPKSQILARAP